MSIAAWTPAARDDLARIDDHHAAIDPAVADRIGRAAIEAGRFLAEHPAAGAETVGGRRWRVAHSPYRLLYRVIPDGVEILRVWHDRRDWPAP